MPPETASVDPGEVVLDVLAKLNSNLLLLAAGKNDVNALGLLSDEVESALEISDFGDGSLKLNDAGLEDGVLLEHFSTNASNPFKEGLMPSASPGVPGGLISSTLGEYFLEAILESPVASGFAGEENSTVFCLGNDLKEKVGVVSEAVG